MNEIIRMKFSCNILFSIKYAFIFVIYSKIIFFDFFFISNNKKDLIEIDNEFKPIFYENETTFREIKTNIKAIAFYYPEYNNISYSKYFHNSKKFKHLDNEDIKKLIKAQIHLAKNHAIYGFAIFFNLFHPNYYSEISINIFLNEINFPFFLIWRNNELKKIDYISIKILINKLSKYMTSDNYIKIKEKPILSINNPSFFLNIKSIILIIRKEAKKRIGEIFIFYPITNNFNDNTIYQEFDATYDFSKKDIFKDITNKKDILYYSGIIYKNLILNRLNLNYTLFRTCYINNKKYKDYNPEKFYYANNIIFEWINNKANQIEQFILVNSWNNYQNGNYLEIDEKYGYASINTFTKSILNIPFQKTNFTLTQNNSNMIAIQIHVFYEELFIEILRKLIFIPFKYDLFISTISEEKKTFIEKCLSSSNANKYEITIFENRGRDILPFLNQMKNKYKNYKYICHLHTKKSVHKKNLGENWRGYIYENLIGSAEIISEIMYDFENNEKLGFIFPEEYYTIIKGIKDFENINLSLNIVCKAYMNYILKRIFKKYKVDEKLVFPVGNMFWAKTKAIYQIFNLRLKYPKEINQKNQTIMHAIERIWLYLVKLNGFYYKTLFKHY